MRRRLLISNVVLVTIVLLALEIPLALTYARHEHDSVENALQRDATSLAALSEEVIEHPGDHDVASLAQRFSGGAGRTLSSSIGAASSSRRRRPPRANRVQ